MKQLWLVVPLMLLLVACATGPKITTKLDLTNEGRLPSLPLVSQDPFALPEGERAAAEELQIRPAPELWLAPDRLDYRLGLSFDGNGVPVLGVPYSVAEAMALIADFYQEQGVKVIRRDLTSARLELSADRFRTQQRPQWLGIFWWQDARLTFSFSEMGEHSRISLWRYNETQPEIEQRNQIFSEITELLLSH